MGCITSKTTSLKVFAAQWRLVGSGFEFEGSGFANQETILYALSPKPSPKAVSKPEGCMMGIHGGLLYSCTWTPKVGNK